MRAENNEGNERAMKCKHCDSSNVHKFGNIKKRNNGKITWRQRYRCYDCLRTMWGKV